MKIAIPTEGEEVSLHFGRAPEFTLIEIEEGKVAKREKIANPGHQAGFLPSFLSDSGVTHVVTGGAGQRAQSLFAQYSIELLVGVTGKVDEVIEKIVHGSLEGSESFCKPGSGKGYGVEKEKEQDASL
jgi:predicted Fe-Mo cluster-binding NifX family protein